MSNKKTTGNWRSRIYIIEHGKPVYSCAQRYKDQAFRQRDLNYPDGVVMLDGNTLSEDACQRCGTDENVILHGSTDICMECWPKWREEGYPRLKKVVMVDGKVLTEND